jgi:stage III sporulation protein AB
MLKLLGAMMVLLSATLFGFYQAQQFSRRPKQIGDLVRSLQRLETEMAYARAPLPQALLQIARTCPAPVNLLFRYAAEQLQMAAGRTVQHIWDEAIAMHWKHTTLKAGEQDIVRQLGTTLGLSDSNDQIKHIRLAIHQLQGELDTAVEERKKYEGMWRSLGLLMGALIVILMY